MATVQLEYAGNVLSGTVGVETVDLVLDVPNSQAGIRGSCLGVSVAGYWHIESNYDRNDPVGVFLGEYGGAPVALRNQVHLTPSCALRHADLTGQVGDAGLEARIASVEVPASGPGVLSIDGTFDDAAFTVYVIQAADHSIRLEGLVCGRTMRLEVHRPTLHGEYSGPSALFPLFACTPFYF